MDFIEELFFGNIKPNEQRFCRDIHFIKAQNTFCDNENKLTEALTREELKLFLELVNASDDINAITQVQNFKLGFRLGVQMMCDSIMTQESDILKDI